MGSGTNAVPTDTIRPAPHPGACYSWTVAGPPTPPSGWDGLLGDFDPADEPPTDDVRASAAPDREAPPPALPLDEIPLPELSLAPGPDGPATPPASDKAQTPFWRTYREVLITVVAGAVATSFALIYREDAALAPTVVPAPPAAAPEAAPAAPAPPAPTRAARPSAEARSTGRAARAPDKRRRPNRRRSNKARAEAAPKAAALPMLSVMSAPSGALVEVDGTIYGRTPLVMPGPAHGRPLRIRLKLDHHRVWQEDVSTNPAGHYVVQADLSATRVRRPRKR